MISISAAASAQTGILDQSAAFRSIPARAKELGNTPQAKKEAEKKEARPQMVQQEAAVGHNAANPNVPAAPIRKIYRPIESDNLNISKELDSLNRYYTERPIPGSHRDGDKPMLFLIGDSTMRTEVDGNGMNGQWGWGYYLENYFNTDVISIENHALGGESTRSFYRTWLFPILRVIRPGDWVVIQLGHNERNGAEMNNGRFRGSLRGAGKEYVEVILEGSGTRERVYTYGEYLRKFVDEIRAKGANPILLSLTSRSGRDAEGKMNLDSKTEVIKTIAEEKGVPYIDFNAAIRNKFDNVFDKRKVDYLFFSDGIHSSSFGAVINAETFVEELRKRSDIALSEALLPEIHYTSEVRKGNNPVLFVCGDSTGKIDNSEESGMVGWGQVAQKFFNEKKITVDNHAKAGRSARTFLDEGRWNVVYDALRPGDYVILQFGHNDGGPINTGKARGEFKGNSDDKEVMTMEANGVNQGIYSFGWYIRKFCLDAIEKGATPIVLSTTPTNWRDDNGKLKRAGDYKIWAKEAAEQVGAYYIDLNEISASKLDKLTPEQVAEYFAKDNAHTTVKGAEHNAKCVAEGIRKIKKLQLRSFVK